MAEVPRRVRRSAFTTAASLVDEHMFMLDDDQDALEATLETINSRINKVLWAVVGLIFSFASAMLLLALNLVVVTR